MKNIWFLLIIGMLLLVAVPVLVTADDIVTTVTPIAASIDDEEVMSEGFKGGAAQNIFIDTTFPYSYETYSIQLPILMYHHFVDYDGHPSPDTVISAERFESHLKALSEAGYNTVSFEELCDFVVTGKALPENPIIITNTNNPIIFKIFIIKLLFSIYPSI